MARNVFTHNYGRYHSPFGTFRPKGGSSTKAPAQPAAAPAPAPAVPFDPAAQAQIAAANNNFSVADLGPGGYQARLQQLDFNYNSPLNPFNRAKMLARAYHQAQSRNTNGYAARGLLYSGALQNAQNAANFNYQQASAAAQQAHQNAKNAILQARAQGGANVTNTTAIANANSVSNAVANPGA